MQVHKNTEQYIYSQYLLMVEYLENLNTIIFVKLPFSILFEWASMTSINIINDGRFLILHLL